MRHVITSLGGWHVVVARVLRAWRRALAEDELDVRRAVLRARP